jgi:hypothetical protein
VGGERQQRCVRYKYQVRPETDADPAAPQAVPNRRDDDSQNEPMTDYGAEGGRHADQ